MFSSEFFCNNLIEINWDYPQTFWQEFFLEEIDRSSGLISMKLKMTDAGCDPGNKK